MPISPTTSEKCAIWRLAVSDTFAQSLTYDKYASDLWKIIFLAIHPNIPLFKCN